MLPLHPPQKCILLAEEQWCEWCVILVLFRVSRQGDGRFWAICLLDLCCWGSKSGHIKPLTSMLVNAREMSVLVYLEYKKHWREWLFLRYTGFCNAHSLAWNSWDTAVHDFGFHARTTPHCFKVTWHFHGLYLASLWTLQHDNKFMCMAVHLHDTHGELFFMTVVLHPTTVGEARFFSMTLISILSFRIKQ